MATGTPTAPTFRASPFLVSVTSKPRSGFRVATWTEVLPAAWQVVGSAVSVTSVFRSDGVGPVVDDDADGEAAPKHPGTSLGLQDATK